MNLESTEVAKQDPLRGFWKAENAAPGPVRQLYGNPREFRKDLVKSIERSVEYIRRLEEDKHLLVEQWPDAILGMTTPDDWKGVRNNNWNSTR